MRSLSTKNSFNSPSTSHNPFRAKINNHLSTRRDQVLERWVHSALSTKKYMALEQDYDEELPLKRPSCFKRPLFPARSRTAVPRLLLFYLHTFVSLANLTLNEVPVHQR
ncbi:hypothetical protein CC2G_002518 [Coprinopsis cinerea AmutBmut pab1-1]|nr:hypothetical protein CC2G_002518 [Coprinopsis cinerea AmutBmut pab1-1]